MAACVYRFKSIWKKKIAEIAVVNVRPLVLLSTVLKKTIARLSIAIWSGSGAHQTLRVTFMRL